MRAIIILLILSGAGYWWHHRRERYKEFEAIEGEVNSMKSTIAERQKIIAMVQKRVEPLRRGEEIMKSPGGSPEQLEQDIETLKVAVKTAFEELDSAEDDFVKALTAVRDRAKKLTFPVLKLPSGRELQECTISKFGEGYISFAHREGTVKVPADDLPEGWVAKYSVDYVSRDSQAEKELLATKIQDATIPALDLKNMRLEQIDAAIAELDKQLLAMSVQIREATRKSDQLVRDGYRIALERGHKGEQAVAQRTKLFDQSKAVATEREVTREKSRALRERKKDLMEQRNEMKKRTVNAP